MTAYRGGGIEGVGGLGGMSGGAEQRQVRVRGNWNYMRGGGWHYVRESRSVCMWGRDGVEGTGDRVCACVCVCV